MKRIRWAVLGTGAIARRFVGDMRFSRHGTVSAIASRSAERARAFAAAIGTDIAHGETTAILAQAEIDAVYVATPNATHAALARAVIGAGKPVLVEKPLATDPGEAAAIAAMAREAGVLAMEAMWMRFTPGIVKLKQWVGEGVIGEIRSIQASLSFAQAYRPDHPLFDPVHGGALLDLGIYPLSLALHLAGEAQDVTGRTTRFDNGAIASAGLVTHHGRALASLSCALEVEGQNEALVVGTHGVVKVHRPFFCPPMLTLRRTRPATASAPEGGSEEVAAIGRRPALARIGALRQMMSAVRSRRVPTLFEGSGLHYQADHFAECLGRGLIESPVMPLADSVAALRLAELVRENGR